MERAIKLYVKYKRISGIFSQLLIYSFSKEGNVSRFAPSQKSKVNNFRARDKMKTIEDLRTRIKELSQQAVELKRKGSEVYETNTEQAKHFREQAREAIKRCEVLRQEIKRQQS